MNDTKWTNGKTTDRQSFNPYEATEFISDESPQFLSPIDAEAIRNEHLKHETSIRGIGTLYLLGAVPCFLMGAAILTRTILAQSINNAAIMGFMIGFAYMVIGSVYFFIGRGLRSFNKTARIGGIYLSCIGLLGFPIGTLISGYFIYLLAGRKGQYIFSDEYQAIRRATPQIVYRTSPIVWVLAALLFLIIIAFVLTVVS